MPAWQSEMTSAMLHITLQTFIRMLLLTALLSLYARTHCLIQCVIYAVSSSSAQSELHLASETVSPRQTANGRPIHHNFCGWDNTFLARGTFCGIKGEDRPSAPSSRHLSKSILPLHTTQLNWANTCSYTKRLSARAKSICMFIS